jgi:large subunit ribosomal protein L6
MQKIQKLKKKEYLLSNFEKIICCYKSNKQCLIVKLEMKEEMYFFIPTNMKILSHQGILQISYLRNCIDSNLFITSFDKYASSRLKKQKLYLKGLGFKMTVLEDESTVLQLKVGLSHLVFLEVPDEITRIFVMKKTLCVESYNIEFLGNFIARIRSYKTPDAYKGKGFYRKYEEEKLKIIKKK